MKWLLGFIAIAAVTFGGWRYGEHREEEEATAQAVETVAPLVEYRELYAEGKSREANDTLLMTVASLIEAENEGADIAEVLRRCEWQNQTPVEYSDLLTEGLRRNLKIARELELDTPENLLLMKAGRSPIVGSGPYAGEKIEVDHIVPRSLAPDLDNLLINLELMPMTLNREKSNRVTARVLETAEKFHKSGVIMLDSLNRVREAAEAGVF